MFFPLQTHIQIPQMKMLTLVMIMRSTKLAGLIMKKILLLIAVAFMFAACNKCKECTMEDSFEKRLREGPVRWGEDGTVLLNGYRFGLGL